MSVTSPVPYYNGIIKGTDTSSSNYKVDNDPDTFTDPLDDDTDNDGLTDGAEDSNKDGEYDAGSETDTNDKDTDDDGLTDGKEVNGFTISGIGLVTTSAISHDTDGDGIYDGTEAGYTNSMIGADTNTTQGHFVSDLDPNTKTNPDDTDTDNDNLSDGIEDSNYNGKFEITLIETDPLDIDTDNDGLPDGKIDLNDNGQLEDDEYEDKNLDGKIAGDTNNNRILDTGETWTETNPLNVDSDDDNLWDGYNIGSNLGELTGHNGYSPTSPKNPDSDDDGVSDGDEVEGWDVTIFHEATMVQVEVRHVYSNPGADDTEGDGVIDVMEFAMESDPTSDDTDGDNILDELEITGVTTSAINGIEGGAPQLSKAEVDVSISWKKVAKFSAFGIKIGTVSVPDGLDIRVKINANDIGGIEYITVDIDGASPYTQYTDSFNHKFDVGYDRYFGSGWDIDVEVMDGNDNIGEADHHINSLWEDVYDLFVELVLFLKKVAEGLFDVWPYFRLVPFPGYWQGPFGLCSAMSCLEIAHYYFRSWENLVTVQLWSKQEEYVENKMKTDPDDFDDDNRWIHNGMYLKTMVNYFEAIMVYERISEDDYDDTTDLGDPTFSELKTELMIYRDPVCGRFGDYYNKGSDSGHAIVIVGFWDLPWGEYGIIQDSNIAITTYPLCWDYMMDHLWQFIYVDGIGRAG